LYGAWLHSQLEQERRSLQSANYRRIPVITLKQVQSHVRDIAEGAVSLHEVSKQQRISLARLARIETYLDGSYMARLQPSRDNRGNNNRRFKHRRR
jgi:hypothetical protein